MSYQNIPSSDVDANSPVTVDLMSAKFKNNLDDHETRILDLEAYLAQEWTAKTGDYGLSADDADGTAAFSNDGASAAIVLTLPAAVAGMKVMIANVEAQSITVAAASGDLIYTEQTVTAGFQEVSNSTKGSSIILWAVNGTDWVTMQSGQWSVSGRGITAGGNDASGVDADVEYYNIAVEATNSTDWGTDLTQARHGLSACSSSTRGVWIGGDNGSAVNTMDYTTITIAGTAFTDFGDLQANADGTAATSNSTVGVIMGGVNDDVQTITIATAGNAANNASAALTTARSYPSAVCSGTRAVCGGGSQIPGSEVNVMEYFTMTSSGSFGAVTDFGDLSVERDAPMRADNATIGYFAGGGTEGVTTPRADYDKITIATTGNATAVANLVTSRGGGGGTSSAQRAIWSGGTSNGSTELTIIDFVNFATEGTATTWGNLNVGRRLTAACSNSHGGLNG